MTGESHLRRRYHSVNATSETLNSQFKSLVGFLLNAKYARAVLSLLSIMIIIGSMVTAVAQPKVVKENHTSSHKNHFITQTAGYLGFVAMGLGREYRHHAVNVMLGYVPAEIGGVEIWQLSFKYDWHPYERIPFGKHSQNFSLDPFYLGFSLTYGMHSNLFVENPPQYPDDYYEPTALRSTLNIGMAVQYQEKYTVFIEYAALDVGVVSYIRHPEFFIEHYDFLGLSGIGSLAAGFKISFE